MNELHTNACDFEAVCSKQFCSAIKKWITSKTFLESDPALFVKQAYEKQFIDHKKQGEREALLCFLDNIKGIFLVISSSQQCVVHADISVDVPLTKTEMVGKSINDVILPQDQTHFSHDFNYEKAKPTAKANLSWFTCRFEAGADKTANQTSAVTTKKDFVTMKCISFMERFKEKAVNNNDDKFILCLGTLCDADDIIKGPPNQTVNNRGEIPLPEKFYTLQDLEGNICEVCTDFSSLFNPSKPPLPADKKDLMVHCLNSFMGTKSNGISVKETILKQVHNTGSATSPSYHFYLPDGVMATSQTKSELIRSKQGREPRCIISVHSVYRNRNFQALNGKNLCPSFQSTSSGSVTEASISVATTSLASTLSFSSTYYLTSTHHPSQSMSIGSFASNPITFASWQNQSRTNMEVTKDLLANVVKLENNFETTVNGIVSPPPHLDGHLVHAVGTHNTPASISKLLVSSGSGFNTSAGGNINNFSPVLTTATECNQDKVSMQDNNLSDPATFPGPPCVNLGNIDVPVSGSVASSSYAATSEVVQGINTVRMDARVTKIQQQPFTNLSTSVNVDDSNISPEMPNLTEAVVSVTDHSSPSYLTSPPRRPLSAFTNTITSNTSLKRSASSMSEDSGGGEVKAPTLEFKRTLSKEKSKPTRRPKILTRLLLNESNSNDRLVTSQESVNQIHSQAASTCTNSVSSAVVSPTRNNLGSPTASSAVNLRSAAMQERADVQSQRQVGNLCKSTMQPLPNSVLVPHQTKEAEMYGPGHYATNASPRPDLQHNVSTEISAEERRELSEIFDDCPDWWNSPGDVGGIDSFSQTPSQQINTDRGNPSVAFGSIAKSFDIQSTSHLQATLRGAVAMNGQNVMSPSNPVPISNSLNQQTFTAAVSPSLCNQSQCVVGPDCLPTGHETCPNKVIGRFLQVPQKVYQPQTAVKQLRDFNNMENWDGKEPLVDLGVFPPPAGINPRMSIPVPSPLNSSMNARTPLQGRSYVATNKQASNVMLSAPPNHFPSNISTASSASLGGNVLSSQQHLYDNGLSFGVNRNGNLHLGLQHQLQPVQGGFNTGVGTGAAPRVPYNTAIRIGAPLLLAQRNGTVFNQRKTSPIVYQGAMSSPSGQYASINPSQFLSDPPAMTSYSSSPIKTGSYSSNTTIYPSHFQSFNSALGQVANISSQAPNHFTSGLSGTFDGMTSQIDSRLPEHVLSRISPSQMVTKQPMKRTPRSRKPRKNSKTKSFDEPSLDESSSGAYKQRPLFQMTIGGTMQQRPQATFNASLDASFTNTVDKNMTASSSSAGRQTLNLNSLINQAQTRVQIDSQLSSEFVHPAFPATNSNNLSWSDVGNDVNMVSSNFPGDIFAGVVEGDMASLSGNFLQPTPNLNNNLFMNNPVKPSVTSTMNTNLNNNNILNITSQTCATSSPTLAVNEKRSTALLEE